MCLEIVQNWLRNMKPEGLETAENAVYELRIWMSTAEPNEVCGLLPAISQTSELASTAQSLWEQIAPDSGGPAYSARS